MKNKCRKLIFLLFSSSRVDRFVKKQNCRNLSLIITLCWFKDPSHSRLCSHVRETCQSKSQLRIHSGPVSDRYEVSLYELIGTLRSDDGDANGNARKAIVLISKTTILHVHHAFLYISLPSLHDYDVKMPNFTMYRGSTQATEATTKFPLPSWTWIWFLGIQL